VRKKTEDNIRIAFAGESQAHMRYLIFAQKAEDEGRPNLARLFRAISYAEQVHATNHFKSLGDLRDSSNNLKMAIDGETYEVEEMYPAFNEVAKLQNEKVAEQFTNFALQAEKVHAGMYQEAKQAIDSGKDVDIGDVYICEVCGWTVEGETPDRCPVCGSPKEKFRKF
jgi:rubrerythrin